MIKISLNEDELKEMYLSEVKNRLKEIESETLLLDSKQLCKLLSLSWPTVEKLFLHDPNFPSMRIGKKWIFNRKEVQKYIDEWSINIRKKGHVINL
ncbi:helix-turn-helix domain-containing protein [Bacillus idriensis]|uniref:Helix-turn-helix domain-containing protein n=1 Tax=Metabacillus idriensis TaxID=324768 RepID=A0A6I2MED5_9BACI|nr:helix-turn-helix domain-containing protein [Metabacillus idriensis]MRX56718.1 helix-turn-helix domain-containing protein [Metabacillus idriensis]